MCSAFLHISFKAHSSGKLLKQNKPIRNFFMFSNAPYNPWNIYPAIPDQRCTRRHKIKRRLQKPGKGYKSHREWRSQTKPVQSWTLHKRKPEAACVYTPHGWQSHTESPDNRPSPEAARQGRSDAKTQTCRHLQGQGQRWAPKEQSTYTDSMPVSTESLTTHRFIPAFLNAPLPHPLES